MILVDTSVLVDILKKKQNSKTDLFLCLEENDSAYGISEYTYLELLQGTRDETEYKRTKQYLLDMKIYMLPKSLTVYEQAAQMFYSLKRQGITPRSTIDILIALTAMQYRLSLLHNDKDFDVMESKMPDLKIYRG
jgi:predicted nucleic acid-binding protein